MLTSRRICCPLHLPLLRGREPLCFPNNSLLISSACWHRIKVFWNRKDKHNPTDKRMSCLHYSPAAFSVVLPHLDLTRSDIWKVLSCPKSLATPFLLPTNSQYSNSCCMQTFLLAFLCPVYFLAAFVLLISLLTILIWMLPLFSIILALFHEGFSFSWSSFPGTCHPPA